MIAPKPLTATDLGALRACEKLIAASPDRCFSSLELGCVLWPERLYANDHWSGKAIRRLVAAGYLREALHRMSDGTFRITYTRTSRETPDGLHGTVI